MSDDPLEWRISTDPNPPGIVVKPGDDIQAAIRKAQETGVRVYFSPGRYEQWWGPFPEDA